MSDLQEHLLEPPADQSAPFKVTDDGSATWALRHLKKAESEVARIHAAAHHERMLIEQWEDRALKSPLDDVGFFKGLLLDYQRRLIDADPDFPKTYKIPGGALTRRAGRARRVVTDVEALKTWLAQHQPDALKVEIQASRIKAETFYRPGDPDVALLFEVEGELIPGVVQVVGEEKFDVKLEADEDDA